MFSSISVKKSYLSVLASSRVSLPTFLIILIFSEKGLLFELKLKDFKSSFERIENGKCGLCLSFVVVFFGFVFVGANNLSILLLSSPWKGNMLLRHDEHCQFFLDLVSVSNCFQTLEHVL